MKIQKVVIENFRGLRKLELELEETTVFVGENNSGKSAILDILRLCLRELGTRRVIFDPFDFHLKDSAAEPSSADPILVEITFGEDTSGEWDDKLTGSLSRQKILQVTDDNRNFVILRVTCAYDLIGADFKQNWEFLNLSGQPLSGISDGALRILQREVAYFYLSALRDAARHFDAKGQFWRPFLKESKLSPEKKLEIEQKLREVNDLVVASHASFEQAKNRLQEVQNVVPMSATDVVSIEAVPARIFDMLSKAQIHLGSPTGAKVPVGRHGEGTQSLAVLMLFSAFLDTWSTGMPIVALEEPEAHLHPSAVRTLWGIITKISGQKMISTHSGDLLSEIDIYSIRRLARISGEIRSFRVPKGLLNDEEIRKLSYHIRRVRGELLFARCWLLVEGETETWIYPAAARALNLNLEKEGIRVVEYSQSDVGLLTKVANALGIPWYCIVDNDSGRVKYEPLVRANFGMAAEVDRFISPYVNSEIHLLDNGYESIYSQFMPAQNLARITKKNGESGYWTEYAENLPSKAKTRGAAAVAVEMGRRGASGVTAEIRTILEKAVVLSGGA